MAYYIVLLFYPEEFYNNFTTQMFTSCLYTFIRILEIRNFVFNKKIGSAHYTIDL